MASFKQNGLALGTYVRPSVLFTKNKLYIGPSWTAASAPFSSTDHPSMTSVDNDNTLRGWSAASNPLAAGVRGACMMASINQKYMYIIGGQNDTVILGDVNYGYIQDDGTINFLTKSALGINLAGSGIAVQPKANQLWLAGGVTDGPAVYTGIWRGNVNGDGSVTNWALTKTVLPWVPSAVSTSYITGKFFITNTNKMILVDTNDSGNIWVASLAGDGTVGPWTSTSLGADTLALSSNTIRLDAQCIMVRDLLYVVGGVDSGASATVSNVMVYRVLPSNQCVKLYETGGPFVARSQFGLAVETTENPRIFVVCGLNAAATAVNTIEVARPDQGMGRIGGQ